MVVLLVIAPTTTDRGSPHVDLCTQKRTPTMLKTRYSICINRNRNKNRNSIFILDKIRQHHHQQTDRRHHHRNRIHSDPIHHGTQFLIQHKTKTHATFLACISNSNRRMILLNVNEDVDAYLNVDVDATRHGITNYAS